MGCECSVRSGPLRASSINQLQIRSVCCFENNVTCVRSVILKGKIRLFFFIYLYTKICFPVGFLYKYVYTYSVRACLVQPV